jgi:ATP-dependent DNA helicase RecQ
MEEDTGREVDEALFESLRAMRRDIALERGVAAFVILHDSTLRELARLKPSPVNAQRGVRGMGERKLADFGSRLVEHIAAYGKTAPAPNPASDQQS